MENIVNKSEKEELIQTLTGAFQNELEYFSIFVFVLHF